MNYEEHHVSIIPSVNVILSVRYVAMLKKMSFESLSLNLFQLFQSIIKLLLSFGQYIMKRQKEIFECVYLNFHDLP